MRCPVCLNELPLQSHHIKPIEYGGPKDGPQVDLCANCHLNIHYTAEGLCSKNGLKKRYLLDDQMNRATQYIEAIIRAKLTYFRESDDIKKIRIEVPSWLLIRLHKRKFDRGFHSLEKYLISLFMKDVTNL